MRNKMNITYQYKILKVNSSTMVVEYTSDNLPSIKLGVPLPVVGNTIENIIAVHAPFKMWYPVSPEYIIPEENTSGEITSIAITLNQVKIIKLNELSLYRYKKETQGITIGDNLFLTTREARTIIFEYYTKIKDKIATSILFKDGNGNFVSLDSSNIKDILIAIDTWVNDCFLEEFDFITQINNCATIQEVNNIVFG